MRLEETINPFEDEKDPTSVPQGTAVISANHVIGLESQTVSKSMVDLAMSESEDEAVPETGLLDVRACPVVP